MKTEKEYIRNFQTFFSQCQLFIVYIPILLLVSISCEDMFMKTIDMDVAGMSPKLSVTATLDADSGRFAIYIFAAHPL